MRPAVAITTQSTCALRAAFDDLSMQAFAVWIRLHTIPRGTLAQHDSTVRLAWLVGLPRKTFMRHVRELQRKGYVRVRQDPATRKVEVVLARRCVLQTPNEFIRI